jgi:hypothetical protein
MSRSLGTGVAVAAAAVLVGCASSPSSDAPDADASPWHAVALPGKAATRYARAHKDGRDAVEAVADRAASQWRPRVERAPQWLGPMRLWWWGENQQPD